MIQAKGGTNQRGGASRSGGTGTVYPTKAQRRFRRSDHRQQSDCHLGLEHAAASTMVRSLEFVDHPTISDNSRVSTPDRVYVANGNPAEFTSLINGGFLQVGTLQVAGTLVFGEADTDEDGIPDSFELANGLNPNESADALNDVDGDGFTNWQEFIAGTNLFDPSSAPQIVETEEIDSGVLISFKSVLGRKYRVECSDKLIGSNWTVLFDNLTGTDSVLEVIDTAGAREARRFYRVEVVP
jgi:hypothetical protein